MALKKEVLEKIAALTKLKVADLETAIKDEKEVDVVIEDGLQTFTVTEIEARDTNQKNDGIKAGKEIGIKEVRKAAGIEESGSKDPKLVADAIVAKAVKDAKVAPDEKVSQLTEQVTLLQKQLGEKDVEITTAKTASQLAALDRRLLASFPKERTSTLTDDEYLTLLKSQHNFKEVDGKIQVEKDGQVLRDGKTQNPLDVATAVSNIFTERKWLGKVDEQPGGRGGGNSGGTPSKAGKLSELQAQFKAAGKSELGEEFAAAVAQAKKDNPDFSLSE